MENNHIKGFTENSKLILSIIWSTFSEESKLNSRLFISIFGRFESLLICNDNEVFFLFKLILEENQDNQIGGNFDLISINTTVQGIQIFKGTILYVAILF